MFNTTRIHRWLTVPAAVVALAGLGTGVSLFSLAIVPPAIALPFLLFAAIRRTDRATDLALTATRAIGWLTVAWGLLCTVLAWPFGLIMEATAITMLVLAGTRRDERRLGAVTALTGAAIAAATIILVWSGADPRLLLAGAAGLVIGGVMWTLEAHHNPETVEVIPTMKIAA